MSESAEGRSVAATRQNSGSRAYRACVAAAMGPAGGLNVPGGTTTAVVMVVAGSVSCASSVQVAACAARGARRRTTTDASRIDRHLMTAPSAFGLTKCVLGDHDSGDICVRLIGQQKSAVTRM